MSDASLPALQPPQPGALYVVATPIGHLGDLSPRAAHLLRECDAVACEDTRVTRGLLAHAGSQRPLLSYHDYKEEAQAAALVEKLRAGQSIALVSDAGTPNVSDPGFRIVRACRRAGLTVIPVPGPSALLAALCASGLPTNGFLFAGFLPPKTSARKTFLTKYRDFEYTLVLYESCHRIAKFADDIVEVLGPGRVVAIAREVTKKFETFLVGPAGEVRAKLAGDNLRGEFTVVIAPADYEL
ncbi:MAG TPA: 16S rRNA (cytidine(1402)-2'-O)-methyltransferase [Opitutales bacterium]|nr:16S rRNA (cytidine(1402)-2'-O)-methyltransferase [Opitutales bacterium]